jgi:hypothetical protein
VFPNLLNRSPRTRLYIKETALSRRTSDVASHPLHDFIRRLRRARSVSEGAHLTDGQLLERFIKKRDEAAFEVLVLKQAKSPAFLCREW